MVTSRIGRFGNGHSRNGRIRNGRSRIGRSRIGTSTARLIEQQRSVNLIF